MIGKVHQVRNIHDGNCIILDLPWQVEFYMAKGFGWWPSDVFATEQEAIDACNTLNAATYAATHITAWNDGILVYKGTAAVFIDENEGDELVIDMVREAIQLGESNHLFFSGAWKIERN